MSITLIICLVLSLCNVSVLASVNDENLTEIATSDGYIVKVNKSTNYIKTMLYDPNGNFVDSTVVNKITGTVEVTDNDGSVIQSKLNDYVSNNSLIHNESIDKGIISHNNIRSFNSLYDEPVTDEGLLDSVYGDGYKFLGSTSLYYCSEAGYLFRIIDRMTKHQTHHFTFTVGTSISTVTGILISVFTGTAIVSSIVFGLFATSAGVIADYFAGTVDYRTYNYLYKVRVKGNEWYNTCRNISYWVSISDYSETTKFVQKSFNYGFSPNNFEMVKAGIDKYVESNQ